MKLKHMKAHLISFGLWLLLSAQKVKAKVEFDYENSNSMQDSLTLSNRDPFSLAILIVNVVSTFLGLVFLIMIIYAGVLWMTNGGHEEQIDKAKSIIKNSVIGLLIIFLSVSIAYLVYALTINATVESTWTQI